MEEIEVPTEHLHETIHEKAHEAGHGPGGHQESGGAMAMYVAMSSALIAVLAALASLLAGYHANDAMIEQLKSTDAWNHYQAKSIKSTIFTAIEELKPAGTALPDAQKKVDDYKKEMEEINERAVELARSSSAHLARHETFARSVTCFQVAIALGAIAVLTRKRRLWLGGLAIGAVGLVFFIQGLS